MLSIGQYRRYQRRWIYIGVSLFLIWIVMLLTSGVLIGLGIINDTDQLDTFTFFGCLIYGVFCGWVGSGLYWWACHKGKK